MWFGDERLDGVRVGLGMGKFEGVDKGLWEMWGVVVGGGDVVIVEVWRGEGLGMSVS